MKGDYEWKGKADIMGNQEDETDERVSCGGKSNISMRKGGLKRWISVIQRSPNERGV